MKISTPHAHPDRWRPTRLKFAAPLRNERMSANSDHADYLGLENIESWTGRIIEAGSKLDDATDDGSGGLANIFREGDVLFGKLRPYLAKACYALRDGVCSTELLVMRPAEFLHPKYLLYSLLTPDFVGAVDASTFGAKMPRASWDFIGSLDIHLPPIEVQSLIANYLDRETARIDDLITQKERMLALLEEKHAALISKVLTRGLNPDAPIKSTVQEWLGKIPDHWNIWKLKYVVTKIGSGITPRGGAESYQSLGIPLLRSQNIHFDGIRMDDVVFIDSETQDFMENSKIKNGDVLLNITGASIGRCFYVEGLKGEANVNQHVCIVRPSNLITTKYLYFIMRSRIGQTQIDLSQSGSGREGLNFEALGNFRLPVPPGEEQLAITEYLEAVNQKSRLLDSAVRNSVEQLKERRAALITAAVSGQILLEEMVE